MTCSCWDGRSEICESCAWRGRAWILRQIKMASPHSDMEVACEHLYVRYGCTEETLLAAYCSETERDPSNERRLRAAYETIAGHALPECGEGWPRGALARAGVQRPRD